MSPVLERLEVNGPTLACRLCGGGTVEHRGLRLDTTILTPLLSKGAVGAVCLTCGYVHVFVRGNLTWTRTDRALEDES